MVGEFVVLILLFDLVIYWKYGGGIICKACRCPRKGKISKNYFSLLVRSHIKIIHIIHDHNINILTPLTKCNSAILGNSDFLLKNILLSS